MITMDCIGNDGSVEEFYLVLLDGRLEYSVRICRWVAFRFSCIHAAVKECKFMLYLLMKWPNMTSSVNRRSSFLGRKAEVGLNNLIENTSLSLFCS